MPARGGSSLAEPRQRRHQGLGPAQRLLFRHAGESGAALRFRRRNARFENRRQGQQVVLHGSGDEAIAFTYIRTAARKGKPIVRHMRLEGIHPNMTRRYRETDSAVVREGPGALPQHPAPALTARARACAARRATCAWARGGAPRHPRREPDDAAGCARLVRAALASAGAKARSPTRSCTRSWRA